MAEKWPDKDPNEVLDYDIEWAGTVDSPGRTYGENVIASTWAIVGSGLVEDSNSFTTGRTKIWLSGGVVGTVYRLTNHITTDGGREMEKTATLSIKEK